MRRCICLLLIAVAGAARPAGAFVLVRDGLPASFIVLGGDAGPAERYAARELSAHVRMITGVALPVRETGYEDIPETGRAVLLGRGDWFENPRFAACVTDMNMLGDQGFVVRCFGEEKPEVLFVCGKEPRGTLYAVYELLRRIGVRWYTKDVTRYPSRKTIDLGNVEISDLPCFDFRGVTVPGVDTSPEWKLRLRLNDGCGFAETELRCPPSYSPLSITVEDLVPSGLFDEQPDLFPLIDGERRAGSPGRCFTNPMCAAVAADSVRAELARHPHATAVVIDLTGYGTGCGCDNCRRVRETGKSESGLVLGWLNSVAGAFAESHPHVHFELVASGPLEAPPERTVPAGNVVIRLSPEGADQFRFYEESIDERTMEFVTHLRGWRRLNARLVVSHDMGNHGYPPSPFPDFHQLFRNLEMYHYEFVEGCFFNCPAAPGLFVADAELRAWVLSELMWDRYRNGDTLVREWMKGVYGNSWGPMMDYWKHVQELARDPGGKLTVDSDPLGYVTDEWLNEADRMLKRAFALSLTDSAAHRRVRRERLGLWYLRLLRGASSGRVETGRGTKRPGLLERFVREFRELGYERVSGEEDIDGFEKRCRGKND